MVNFGTLGKLATPIENISGIKETGFYVLPEKGDPAYEGPITALRGTATGDDTVSFSHNLYPDHLFLNQTTDWVDPMDPAGTAFHFRYWENGNVSGEAKLEVLRTEMQDYASSLPEGVGAQIFIVDHGDVGSPDNQTPAGFGSTHNYIAYGDFLSALPGNTAGVFINGCFSESALDSLNHASSGGILVFPSVSGQSLAYSDQSSDRVYGKQNVETDLTAQDAFKYHLSVGNFFQYADDNAYYNANDENYGNLAENTSDIIPTRFGISGYGVIDLKAVLEGMSPDELEQAATDLAEFMDAMETRGLRTFTAETALNESLLTAEYLTAIAEQYAEGAFLAEDKDGPLMAIAFTHLEQSGELARMIEAGRVQHAAGRNMGRQTPLINDPVLDQAIRDCGNALCDNDVNPDEKNLAETGESPSSPLTPVNTLPKQERNSPHP